MKKYIIIFTLALAGLFVSCGDDFLNRVPYNQPTAGQPASMQFIDALVTGAYRGLILDCSGGQWKPIIGYFDMVADNAFSGGGDANDQAWLQRHTRFMASATTQTVTGWWNMFYDSIQRTNLALAAIDNATDETIARHADLLEQRRAELYILRAWYAMWLWKAYGNIPFFTEPWDGVNMSAPQRSQSEMVGIMLADLDRAIAIPQLPDVRPRTGEDRGRVHRYMAFMVRARVLLHANGIPGLDPAVRTVVQGRLPQILTDMQRIINHPQFGLVTEGGMGFIGNIGGINNERGLTYVENPFEWIFLGGIPTAATGTVTGGGEFSSESVFEVLSQTNPGFAQNTPQFSSIRQPTGSAFQSQFASGWGFMTVRPDAYAIFEYADRRRTVSVLNFGLEMGADYRWHEVYMNTGLWMGKYTARWGNNRSTAGTSGGRWNNNRRYFRIAEAYLTIAELQVIHGVTAPGVMSAQAALDAIRDRAFGTTTNRIPATASNIKLEWRREFFGEGLRFWQLLRWNFCENGRPLSEVLGSVTFNVGPAGQPPVVLTRTWREYYRLLPIPQRDIDQARGLTYELVQNPGF